VKANGTRLRQITPVGLSLNPPTNTVGQCWQRLVLMTVKWAWLGHRLQFCGLSFDFLSGWLGLGAVAAVREAAGALAHPHRRIKTKCSIDRSIPWLGKHFTWRATADSALYSVGDLCGYAHGILKERLRKHNNLGLRSWVICQRSG
jgi:hypothetical protein